MGLEDPRSGTARSVALPDTSRTHISPSRTLRAVPEPGGFSPGPTARRPSALRRAGSRTLGLVATLTLVLLVGLGGIGVYLTAPRDGGDQPSAVAGLSTPTNSFPREIPADLLTVPLRTCDTPEADYDTTMRSLLQTSSEDVKAARADTVAVEDTSRSYPVARYRLPEGTPPSGEDVELVVDIYGRYQACSSLGRVAAATDDFLLRQAFSGNQASSFYLNLWATQAGEPGRLDDSTFSYSIYGIRRVDGSHLAAYLAPIGYTTFDPESGGIYDSGRPTYDQTGYVVIERQADGRWLVDDLVEPLVLLDEARCIRRCATPDAG